MSERMEAALLGLLTSLPPLVAAIAAWVQAKRAAMGVNVLRRTYNGRLDQLIAAEVRAAIAEAALAKLTKPPEQTPPPP